MRDLFFFLMVFTYLLSGMGLVTSCRRHCLLHPSGLCATLNYINLLLLTLILWILASILGNTQKSKISYTDELKVISDLFSP